MSTIQNFQEYISNMIKDQSDKIQAILKKIQINAHNVMKKIDRLKLEHKETINKVQKANLDVKREEYQVESPEIEKKVDNEEGRNFNGHYPTTGYGASGNGNYGTFPSYHHHSIGFDPINIVVSVSLLSFLLQALQGLLSRTKITPTIEARSLNNEDWVQKMYQSNRKSVNSFEEYWKKKYPKKLTR